MSNVEVISFRAGFFCFRFVDRRSHEIHVNPVMVAATYLSIYQSIDVLSQFINVQGIVSIEHRMSLSVIRAT